MCLCTHMRELTSIIACLGGTSYWYIKISYLAYYYMLISYFLASLVYYLVKRCLIPLIITSMILLLRIFHPRCENRLQWITLLHSARTGNGLTYSIFPTVRKFDISTLLDMSSKHKRQYVTFVQTMHGMSWSISICHMITNVCAHPGWEGN